MDASKLGETVKEGKNQKTLLRPDEEQLIIETFNAHKAVEDFAVVVGYEQIKEKNYSLSAGQYFKVKINFKRISSKEFSTRIETCENALSSMMRQSILLDKEILANLKNLVHE
jgi:type I restriction enzyme M protein